MTKGITAKKSKDMPEWYGQVVTKAGLADYSPVRGTMIIRPYGYAIWQRIMDLFNATLQKRGVENAYFPLFIPESFFRKEQAHATGFAPEVAWVENKDENAQERLAIRPTSETIIYDSFARWIRSHRDLPLRVNQWCNIVRWEVKDVKLFLRSREFLWQEGHCAYATEEECVKETLTYLDDYEALVQDQLAIPVLKGEKSVMERFAGARMTTAVEAYMPDSKFLQCGTSHHLGQGFAKAFGITFQGLDEKKHHPHQNSWGFSTRLIGAIVMQHGDDKGLVLPPNIAPKQVVVVPILFDDSKDVVLKEAKKIISSMRNLRSHLDDRDEYSAGWKFNEWEMKGVPVRIEIGPKDLAKKQCVLVRRDTGEKMTVPLKDVSAKAKELLETIQARLFQKAHDTLKKKIAIVETRKDFDAAVAAGKIVYAPFKNDPAVEQRLKEETAGVTSRCIPFGQKKPGRTCVISGEEADCWAYFGKCY